MACSVCSADNVDVNIAASLLFVAFVLKRHFETQREHGQRHFETQTFWISDEHFEMFAFLKGNY